MTYLNIFRCQKHRPDDTQDGGGDETTEMSTDKPTTDEDTDETIEASTNKPTTSTGKNH